jgi:hypothetical protein
MSRADRWKSYAGPSEAQSNADALARRGRTYADANAASWSLSMDYHKRQPRDLRDAVRMCRRAYADEIPTRMHNQDLADDGTPRMTPQAEAFIFGSPTWTDAGRSEACSCGKPERDVRGIVMAIHARDCPALGNHAEAFYLTPFRATLATMERASEPESRRAAIVGHVTIGSQGPKEAAIAEGVPSWCAATVAEDALRSFLRRLSDVRVDVTEAVA